MGGGEMSDAWSALTRGWLAGTRAVGGMASPFPQGRTCGSGRTGWAATSASSEAVDRLGMLSSSSSFLALAAVDDPSRGSDNIDSGTPLCVGPELEIDRSVPSSPIPSESMDGGGMWLCGEGGGEGDGDGGGGGEGLRLRACCSQAASHSAKVRRMTGCRGVGGDTETLERGDDE